MAGDIQTCSMDKGSILIRNRFFHFPGEDALSLTEKSKQSHLNWVNVFRIFPMMVSLTIIASF